MVKKVWDFLKIYIVIYLVLIFSFIALLYVAAIIPETERFKAKMKESSEIMLERAERYNGNYSRIIGACQLDDFTDCIILNLAYCLDPDNVVTQYYRYIPGNEIRAMALHEAVENPEQTEKQEYSRYWHGHPAVVRIVHCLFSVRHLYQLIGAFTLVLTVVACLVVYRKNGFLPAVILGLSMAMSSFFVFSLSLQFYPVFWIGLASVIFLCWQDKSSWRMPAFFAIGMICPFFDFLTVPAVTLVMPMMVVCGYDMLRAESENKEAGKRLQKFLLIFCGYAVAWGCGYILSWGTKILFAAFAIGNLQKSLNTILFRVGASNYAELPAFSRMDSVLLNIETFLSINGYFPILIFLFYIAVLLWNLYLYKCKKVFFDWIIFSGYVLIALLPLGMIFVSANHAYIHVWFTYRGVVFAYSAFLMTITAFRPVIQKSE